MKTILTYGTFDLFHVGHLKLLQRCRDFGDRLIVGVSTDEFNALKGKRTVIGHSDRSAIVNACKYVDFVFPEVSWDQKRGDIIAHNVDLFVMGDDWSGKFDDLSDLCTVTYLARTPDVSSTDIKSYINKIYEDKINGIKLSIDKLKSDISNLEF